LSNLAADLRDTDDDKYDLYVGKRWRIAPQVRSTDGTILEHTWDTYPLDTVHANVQIEDVRLWSGGVMYLGLPWSDACCYARALHEAKGAGVLVPTRYREPRVTLDDGLALAMNEFRRIRDQDTVYGEGNHPADNYCCWRYAIPNLTAQARGVVPGVVFIYVHKLTGRICSAEEVSEWTRRHVLEEA